MDAHPGRPGPIIWFFVWSNDTIRVGSRDSLFPGAFFPRSSPIQSGLPPSDGRTDRQTARGPFFLHLRRPRCCVGTSILSASICTWERGRAALSVTPGHAATWAGRNRASRGLPCTQGREPAATGASRSGGAHPELPHADVRCREVTPAAEHSRPRGIRRMDISTQMQCLQWVLFFAPSLPETRTSGGDTSDPTSLGP